MLDFSRIKGFADYGLINDIASEVDWHDLTALTNEMYDTLEATISDVGDADVDFVPNDPQATTDDEVGWTIPHIIAHLTATQEESAAHSAQLARGSVVEGRSRYEMPWEELTTVQQVRDRLRESRRICLAYLSAWPDQPHFEIGFHPFPGSPFLTPVSRYVFGLQHTTIHLHQLQKTLRQLRA